MVRGGGGLVASVDERPRGGWSVCPVGTGEEKYGARGGFFVTQGKIGGRGAGVARRAGEEEGNGEGVAVQLGRAMWRRRA
jgi:hypothetical protein